MAEIHSHNREICIRTLMLADGIIEVGIISKIIKYLGKQL